MHDKYDRLFYHFKNNLSYVPQSVGWSLREGHNVEYFIDNKLVTVSVSLSDYDMINAHTSESLIHILKNSISTILKANTRY